MAIKFNKKNAIEFANYIYTENKHGVSFAKLCKGELAQKTGGKSVHCAIGAAYAWFVNTKMPKGDEYHSKHGVTPENQNARAIDALVKVANLKYEDAAEDFAAALAECMTRMTVQTHSVKRIRRGSSIEHSVLPTFGAMKSFLF